MTLSLRASLTLKMMALFLGAGLVLGGVAFWQARRTVADLADRIVKQTSSLIDGSIGALLAKAESNGRVVASMIAPSTGGQPTLTDASQFASLAAKAYEVMSANAQFSSIRFTLERTGERVVVVQRPNGSLVVQTSILVAGGRYQRQDKVPFGDEWRTIYEATEAGADQRTSLWYQAAREQQHPIWTEAYVIRGSIGPDTPGVTYAVPVFDRGNTFLGVLAIDFTIADLSRFLETIEVGKRGYAALLEYNGKSVAKVIAHPQSSRLVIPEGLTQRLATVNELGDPPLAALVKTLKPDLVTNPDSQAERKTVRAEGELYQTGLQRVSGDNAPHWFLAVVVPEEEFMAGVWQTGAFLAVLGSFAVIGVLLISSVVAQRVAKPLQDLSEETRRVRSLDLEPRPSACSNVREIDQLSGAMEQMKTGLRSLEKLVPGDYARHLIASGQEARLGGERRHITTYFADIIGFTALSERMEPEELVEVLAEYLDVLSGVVLQKGGTVDKFNGDDVMAFWGAPNPTDDHALLACEAALASKRTLEHLHVEWQEHGRPLLRASFGIATGDVVVGNVGSRQRMNYTVIGDSVNLASRLQGLNKFYSTEILASEQTILEAGSSLVSRQVDWASIAGRDEPAPVYEILALRATADAETLVLEARHRAALGLYRARKWDEAIALFDKTLQLLPHDGPSRILRDRCVRFESDPPGEEWDGAVHMHLK